MNRYLIIESRDPFESASLACRNDLATSLAAKAPVTVFLVENAVLAARTTARYGGELGRLRRAGVKVMADEFALRERGIDIGQLSSGIEAAPIDLLVAELGRGAKAIWC